MKKLTQTDYFAFLLRMWRDGETAPWRASLENTSTGETTTFAEIRMLVAFLSEAAGEGPQDGAPTTKPGSIRARR